MIGGGDMPQHLYKGRHAVYIGMGTPFISE